MCELTQEPFEGDEAAASVELADEMSDEAAASVELADEMNDEVVAPKRIKSHMAAAIITTVLFGNWILGIPAIVFARECEMAAENGQSEIAQRFSRRALTFLCIGSALSVAAAGFLALIGVIASSFMYW